MARYWAYTLGKLDITTRVMDDIHDLPVDNTVESVRHVSTLMFLLRFLSFPERLYVAEEVWSFQLVHTFVSHQLPASILQMSYKDGGFIIWPRRIKDLKEIMEDD